MIIDRTPEARRKLKDAVAAALASAVLEVQRNAKDFCPVDTGNLKGSITHEVGATQAKVGTNVHYSVYVEMGTVKMAAQPFLMPGLVNSKNKITQLMKQKIGDALRTVGK